MQMNQAGADADKNFAPPAPGPFEEHGRKIDRAAAEMRQEIDELKAVVGERQATITNLEKQLAVANSTIDRQSADLRNSERLRQVAIEEGAFHLQALRSAHSGLDKHLSGSVTEQPKLIIEARAADDIEEGIKTILKPMVRRG